MGPQPPDENLPEVVPPRPFEVDGDASPQVVSQSEKPHPEWYGTERDKYPIVYDDTPKLVGEYVPPKPDAGGVQQPWSPSTPVAADANNQLPDGEAPNPQRTIWGLKRRTFFILAAILSVVLLGAIIGGAVGGTVSKKSSDSSPSTPESASDQGSSNASDQPSTMTTASTGAAETATTTATSGTSSPSATTSDAARPTQAVTLNNGSAPHDGLAFQAFSAQSYLGTATTILQEEGFYDLNISALSYVWLPDGTPCCLTFCADKTTATGYWCDTRYQPSASGPFARVYIWCGTNDGIKPETCS